MASSEGGGKLGTTAWLLIGVIIGILGTIFVPRLADPYLPDALRGDRQEVTGTVEAKSAEVDRLLLTVGGEAGAMLVTFSKDVAEIDLLVDVGDTVVLEVEEYAPFVDDPRIRRVAKKGDARRAAEMPAQGEAVEDSAPDEMMPAEDSVPTAETMQDAEVAEP